MGGEIAETSGQERVRPQNFTQEVGIDLPGILDKENKESIQFKVLRRQSKSSEGNQGPQKAVKVLRRQSKSSEGSQSPQKAVKVLRRQSSPQKAIKAGKQEGK